MRHVSLLILAVYVAYVNATELTFELPDNEKQCFYEDLEQGVKFDIDFQVIVLRPAAFQYCEISCRLS